MPPEETVGPALPALDMRAATAAFDWSATPLGPAATWPVALRTTIELMLSSRFAMCVAWGPEHIFFYNDAYASILGTRHPGALGRPMPRVWPDVWPDIEPLAEEALSGRPTWREDLHLVMTRKGYAEDTYWSFSYSPLRDDSGEIAGFLNVTVETTGKVENARRLETESLLLRESEARFRALVNATADVIYKMSPDWLEMRLLDGRGFLQDITAPSVRWIELYIPEEDRHEVLATIARALEGKAPFELRHRVVRADGTIGWTHSRAVPIFDDAGDILEWFGTASDVTREHEAQMALAASQEHLELATRAARLGQFDYWPRQNRLEWDDRCRELFGLSPDATVTYEHAYVAGLHPDDRAHAIAAVNAALDPRGSHLFDTEYRTIGIEDGLERHIHAQGTALFEGDEPVRLIGTVQDITADRRAQAKLREVSERLRLANRATNDAIWDWDLLRDHVQWNETLERAYGHKPEDVEPDGAWWIGHIHPEDRARVDHSIHAVIDGTGTDWTDEYRFRCADGRYVDVKDRGYVIRNEQGLAVRMIGAMLDQTDRMEAERTLARAKAGLEEAVEARTRERDQIWRSTPDLLSVATLDGWYRELNPAWETVLGWSHAELLARPFLDFVHPEDVVRTQTVMGGLIDGESVFGFENRYRHKSGDYLWFNWNAVPRDGFIYAVVRDVSETHRQREALARAEDQLRQAQKMEAVGQLTGGIAHDFNNMLTGIIGSMELLKRYVSTGQWERVDRYIDAAMTSAQRAAGLTQRLLAFSRRQSLDVRAADVNGIVIGMDDLLRNTLGEDIALALRLQPSAWNARTDANQLESALLNLVINARDAMPDGGTLTIATANKVLDAATAREIADLEPGDYMLVSVSDTGTGMSADIVSKAFDPFFTTKPIGQGTGLGLSMIYGFVRQSGGHIRILSREGEGTTVELYLRRDEDEPAQAEGAAEAVPSGKGECIMLVEDEPAVRMLIADILESLGYDLLEAVDGPSAVKILEKKPAISLLVTDVGLPGMNGRQVAEFAREKIPGLKVLFVSGYAEQAQSRSDFLAPGMDMISKPFVIDHFASKVREMIET